MLLNDNFICSLHEINGPDRGRKSTRRWLRVKDNLDSLARQSNFQEFDENFMHYLSPYWKHSNSYIPESYAVPTNKTSLKFAPGIKHNFIPEACYALKMIFTFEFENTGHMTSDSSKISLRRNSFVPNTFRWLVSENYLTPELVLKALRPSVLSNPSSKSSIDDGDIMKAILANDSDLYVLSIVLENPFTLSILDTILAIKAILSTLNDENLQLLRANENIDRQDIETEMSRQEAAACSDIDRGLANLEVGINMRGVMLQRALTRLQTFGSSKISYYLREYFSNYELLFLLRLLRIEITEGGWTLRYIGSDVSEIGCLAPDEQAMSIILGLMSSVINAVGITGWLVDPVEENDKNSGELLLVLQAEISRVLEGVTEATFMAGLLDEFLRHDRRKKSKPIYKGLPQADLEKDGHEGNGQILARNFTGESLLLSGAAKDKMSRETRKGTRGELKKRSRREIGMQLSMKKSKYSRDKIQV